MKVKKLNDFDVEIFQLIRAVYSACVFPRIAHGSAPTLLGERLA